MTGPVERAARRDLRKADPEKRGSGVAQAALLLARRLDGREVCGSCAEEHPQLSARDEATTAREFRMAMESLTLADGGSDVDNALAALAAELGSGVPPEVEHAAD